MLPKSATTLNRVKSPKTNSSGMYCCPQTISDDNFTQDDINFISPEVHTEGSTLYTLDTFDLFEEASVPVPYIEHMTGSGE